jgi:hypothetical protein
MKSKYLIFFSLLLMTHLCFAQVNVGTEMPEAAKTKHDTPKNSVGNIRRTIQNDSTKTTPSGLAEGKKGLNAVNVRNAVNEDPTNTPTQDHAINTKGTGAINGRTTKPNGQDDGNPFPPKNGTSSLQKPKEKSNDK